MEQSAKQAPGEFRPLSVTLRLLEIFLSVTREGSLSAAAARLGLTHSAVSQSLSALEQALAVKLLDRSVRPPSLTLAGQIALRRAESLVAEAQKLEEDMRYQALPGRITLLRIGMLDSFASVAGAFVLDQLRDVAEKWTVASGTQATSIQALLQRHSDVVITSNETHIPSDIEALPVMTEPFVLAVPAAWPAEVTNLRQLVKELDFIRYSRNVQIKALISSYLERAKVDPPHRYEFDTTDAALRMVGGGFGWTIMTPLMLLKSMALPQTIRLLPLPSPRMSRQLVVAMRRGEGGTILRRVHAATIQTLREVVMPQIEVLLPQLAREVQLPVKTALHHSVPA